MTATASSWNRVRVLLALLLCAGTVTEAHNGPPFPMISDHPMGPCIVSLWTHPDVGTGTFFVVVNPAPGQSVPKDIRFEIGVLPVSGRLAEKRYGTTPQKENGQMHYYAWVPFDREETWRVHLYMKSSGWSGEVTGDVAVTPTGFGQWDLLFFAFPFLGIALLWMKGLQRRRRTRARPSLPAQSL